MNYAKDPFFQQPRIAFQTRESLLALPMYFYDARIFVSMFHVDYQVAKEILNEPEMKLVRVGKNKALLTLTFFSYADSCVGPYNEVGMGLAVVPQSAPEPKLPLLTMMLPPDKRALGFNVIDLPVTSKEAVAAGQEIWALPKFETPIHYDCNGASFNGVVEDPENGEPLMSLSGRAGIGLPIPAPSLVLYSQMADTGLERIEISTRGMAMARLPGSVRIKVGNSDHPMAKRLRALGLDGAKPLVVQHSDNFQARLANGHPIASTEAKALATEEDKVKARAQAEAKLAAK